MLTNSRRAEINLVAERRARATTGAALQRFITLADAAFPACGLERPQRPRAGENPMGYRASVMEAYLTGASNGKWIPSVWASYDPEKEFVAGRITDKAADSLAEAIFKMGTEEHHAPKGEPRTGIKRDQTGREFTVTYGDEASAWLPFTSAIAANGEAVGFKVGRINGDLFTGKNGPEARAQEAQRVARIEAGLALLDAASGG